MTEQQLIEAGVGKIALSIVYDGCYLQKLSANARIDLGILRDTYFTLDIGRVTKIINKELNVLSYPHVSFGSDPELFVVSKEQEVIPSTAVITSSDVVKPDGFQIELNPLTSTCRQSASSYIYSALFDARAMALKMGYDLSFKVGHIISDEVWSKVDLKMKRFGCNPTLNVHEKNFKRVTGLREKFRAGGGHIHLGFTFNRADAPKIVTMMDILAGNTFVLIDRDPDNIRRRINYGRAGEYRLKSYGIEYRVLSNFWMKKYVLWSMATGLLREAIAIGQKQELVDKLLAKIDLKDVRNAINNNDKELAMKNFMLLREFIIENDIYSTYGLSFINIDAFLNWASQEDPIAELNVNTVDQIMDAWERNGDDYDGMELFLMKRKAT
jgi:hypothetical protein